MRNNVIASKISSKYFDYTSKDRLFCCEASGLPKSFNFLSEIYNDACDAGFIMVGEKTGIEVIFYLTETDIYHEKIVGWNYKPEEMAIRKYPEMKDVSVLIIND